MKENNGCKWNSTAILFSPLAGQITHLSRPAEFAEITLTLKSPDMAPISETFNCDKNGVFSLPIFYRDHCGCVRSVEQTIMVNYNQIDVKIWAMKKNVLGLFSELNGLAESLTCELGDDFEDITSLGGELITSCRWEKIIIPPLIR